MSVPVFFLFFALVGVTSPSPVIVTAASAPPRVPTSGRSLPLRKPFNHVAELSTIYLGPFLCQLLQMVSVQLLAQLFICKQRLRLS